MSDRDETGKFAPGNRIGKGRPPKGQTMTDILSAKVSADEIADMLINKAREGDLAALKYIYDRIDGRPTETIRGTGDPNEEIILRFVDSRREDARD